MVRIILTLQDVVLLGLLAVILAAVFASLVFGFFLSLIGRGMEQLKKVKRRGFFREKDGEDNKG